MKKIILIPTLLFALVNIAQAGNSKATKKKAVIDSHTSIYTEKIKRVANAIEVGGFETYKKYSEMLETACKRNNCSPLEKKTIQSVGEQLVNCQITHLKSHGIENADATNICESKQAMFGCDSLASPLLRRMCYSGNRYSLKIWQSKEKKFRSRMPASK